MEYTITTEDFKLLYESTGEMKKESATTFVQTYRRKNTNFPARFIQCGKGDSAGKKWVKIVSID